MKTILPFSFIRTFATNSKKKLAVVGSGPAAFYTVLHILKDHSQEYEIDMFEKDPSPYGLVRYGVAPDHPEVKNCIERFQDVEEYGESFKYFGNVPISDSKSSASISLKDIYDNYNGVLYAYGSSEPNLPPISGIEHPAVIDSKTFVGWYNNHPNYQNFNPPLEKVKTVSIVGNGNVAVDIVRILLGDIERWSKTDISIKALAKLRESKVETVNVVARKGILESKFTNKELRELLEMDKEGVFFGGYNHEDFDELLKVAKLGRVEKRRVSLIEKYAEKYQNLEDGKKKFTLNYLKNPIGFKVASDDLLKEMIVSKNEIIFNEVDGSSAIAPAGSFADIETDLVILATGYKAEPLEEFKDLGIPFEHGRILNKDGKVPGVENTYCVGWVATGSIGNINSTVMSSSITAETIIEDMKNNETVGEKEGRNKLELLLKDKGIKPFLWDQWKAVEVEEAKLGGLAGKVAKRINFEQMKKL